MAKLTLIAAIGKNNELGKDNKLMWHLKGDLKYFKENTINHKIVMGYNTFKSFPRLLPGREHIVLTHRDLNIEGVNTFNNFEDLMNYLNNLNEEVYIIGGASIYQLFIAKADELLLTEIDCEYPEADVYFPDFIKEDCKRVVIDEKEENGIKYRFVKYVRRPEFMISYEEFCEKMDIYENQSETWNDSELEKFASSHVKKIGTKEKF